MQVLLYGYAGYTGLLLVESQRSRVLGTETLPTKVCLVKAMVFPVVTYGFENQTIKKAECRKMLLNCGVGENS